MLKRRNLLVMSLVAAMSAGSGFAQEGKPESVTIVLPHGVGGGQDRLTRELGAVWEKYLGVPVIYENVSGASGRKGFDFFLRQPKDGSFVLSSNLASASIMYRQQKPDWDWKESVYALGMFAVDPGAFFSLKDSGYETLSDVIESAKEKPMTVGLAFWASPDNIVVHQVMKQSGAQFQVVPIGGGSDTVTAVLGKHVDIGFTKVANIEGNEDMKFLAVSMEKNPVGDITDNAPTVNSVIDTKTVSSASYRGIVLPAEVVKEKPEIAKWLSDTLEQAKDDPDFIAAAERDGVNPNLIVDMSHEEIMSVIEGYWEAFDEYGEILNEAKSN